MELSPHTIDKILSDSYPNTRNLTKLRIRLRRFVSPIGEIVKSIPLSESILDVGCGTGLMMVILAHLGKIKRGIGIDISQNAINIARTALIPHGCDITFLHIPKHGTYPIGVFDTILCLHVLHHVPRVEQRGFIRKLARISASKSLILMDISPKPFWMAILNSIHDLLISKEFVHYSGGAKVQKWLQEEGFSVIDYRSIKTLWYSHYIIVAKKKI